MLIIGETSMNLDLSFDFGTFDGLWLMLGLPVLALLIFLLLSPLSFQVHKLISRTGASGVPDNEANGCA